MAIGPDRVQVLKQESASLGGDSADDVPYPAPIDPQEDALESAGLYLQDAANRDENVYLARDGNNLTFRDVGNPTPVTLTQLTSSSNPVYRTSLNASSSTSSNAYQQRLRLTQVVAAGDYLILWHALIATTSANKNFQARVQVDDVTTLSEIQSRVPIANQDYNFTGFAVVTLTAASHFIDIDWSSTSSSSTSISLARIIMWKVP